MATDTVEWGSESRRMSGISRWLSAKPPRHVGTISAGLAVLGFALTLTAEMLPWLEITLTSEATGIRDQLLGLDTSASLTQLVIWQAPAYYLGVTALLALVALALSGRRRARRAAAVAAVGVAAGQAVLLAGVHAAIQEGADAAGLLRRLPEEMAQFGAGEGFYSAAAGLLLLAAAGALAGWRTARPKVAPDASAGAGAHEPAAGEPDGLVDQPTDLAVTPADPFRNRS